MFNKILLMNTGRIKRTLADLSSWAVNTYSSSARESMTRLDLSGEAYLSSVNPTNLYNSLSRCFALTDLSVVREFDTSQCTDISSCFYGDISLERLNLLKWDTSNITDMSGAFDTTAFSSLDLSTWDTSNVTKMRSMFGSGVIGTLDLSNFSSASLNTSTASHLNGFYYIFDGNPKNYLILNSTTVKFVPTANSYLSGSCKILVPNSALSAYKSNSFWSTVSSRIEAIEDYTIWRNNGEVEVFPKTYNASDIVVLNGTVAKPSTILADTNTTISINYGNSSVTNVSMKGTLMCYTGDGGSSGSYNTSIGTITNGVLSFTRTYSSGSNVVVIYGTTYNNYKINKVAIQFNVA